MGISLTRPSSLDFSRVASASFSSFSFGSLGLSPELLAALRDLNREHQMSVSQCALPDLNRERQTSVGAAGPQLRAPDLSGHCRTSAARARAQWGTAGPQLQEPDLNGDCGTPIASARCHKENVIECLIECQNISHIECQIECQNICQIECQIECQNIRQIECQNICEVVCHDRLSD